MSTDSSTSTTPTTNRRGTFSKAKSFRRAALNLEVQGTTGNQNAFRFLSGEEYSGPELIENIKKPNINTDTVEYKTPVFLGANGTLYNKYYIAIKYIGIDEQQLSTNGLSPSLSSSSSGSGSPATTTTNKKSTTTTPATTQPPPSLKKNSSISDLTPYLRFNSTDSVYTSFPDHLDYDDYIDYEQSLIEWKQQVEDNIGVIQLPHSVGRTYSRPKVIHERLFRKNSEASNDDSLSYEMERKLTDSDMKDMSSVNDGDDSTSFSHHSPNTRTNMLSSVSDVNSNSGGPNINSTTATTGSATGGPNNSNINLRERSNSDTSTGSFEGTQLDGTSPSMDGSPSSLAGFLANGTRSRSNSSTYFDHRNQRSNSLSPKHTLQGRLAQSGGYNGVGGDAESNYILPKDPWDAQLILTEPHPDLFSTFEEYEYSMKNWATEVITKAVILPPHPSQFIQLPSKDNKEGVSVDGTINTDGTTNNNNGGGKKMEFDFTFNRFDWTLRPIIRPIITEEIMIFNRILCDSKLRHNEYRDLFKIDTTLEPSHVWKGLVQDEKFKITDQLDRWYRKKLTIQRQTSSYFRGGLWSNHFLMPTIQPGWRESIVKKGSLLPPLSLKAIRRPDINSEADGKRVELSYPIPELPINFTKLLPPNMNLQYFLGMFEIPSVVQTGSGVNSSGNVNGGVNNGINSGGSNGLSNSQNNSGGGLSSSTNSSGSSGSSKDSGGSGSKDSGQTVNYIAMHSISNTTNIGTKEDRRHYVKTLSTYEQRLAFSFRLDYLNSWADTKQYTPMELQEKKMEIDQLVATPGFDLQNGVWSLINNQSQFLDKFQEAFDQHDFRMFAPTIPMLPAIVPLMMISSSSNSSPNTTPTGNVLISSGNNIGVGRSGSTSSPLSPHIPGSSLLNSPPNRQGSTGSFSFANSPGTSSGVGGKISPSSSTNSSASGIIGNTQSTSLDSPRTGSQLAATVERGGSPRNNHSPSSSTQHLHQHSNSSSGSGHSSNIPSATTNTFLSLISTDSFPELLKFIDLVNEPLASAKVSTLAMLSLTSELKGTMVIESILFSKDLASLYRLARAISYFDAVPLDLFPYPTHLNEMLTPSIFKGSTQEVVRLVFVYYYLGIIQERLNFYCNNVGVLGFINGTKKDAAERIGIQFQNDKDFLFKIFRALGRKSLAVSNCFLFVLIQLIKMSESPTVQSLLKNGLLDHVRDLSHSKFSHSQFAAKRLYQILQEDPWKEFLVSSYTESIKKNESLHLSDLTTCKEDGSNSIISELTFNFLQSVLENINSAPIAKSTFKFILNDLIFFQLYNAIVKSKKFTQNTELISKLFSLLCKVLSKFSLLKNNESIKSGGKQDSKKQSDIETGVSISPTLLFEIVSFLQNSPTDTSAANKSYIVTIKTNMLVSLRQLLKVSEIFETVKKEANFYNKFLIPACRDGKNQEFNRNVWRLFFQMIRYHHGHIDYLEKSKYLTALMDIISLNAGNVILTNALHYLCKLFALFSYESRKNALRSPGTTAIDTKYCEKDVKTLINFFVERRFFIKFHMIYKKLTENTEGSLVDQRLLGNITTFYRVISFLPSCQKLLKDTLKNSEFKNGIIQVSKMYKPNETF